MRKSFTYITDLAGSENCSKNQIQASASSFTAENIFLLKIESVLFSKESKVNLCYQNKNHQKLSEIIEKA